MNINTEVKTRLSEYRINFDDGIACLLAIYYNLKTSYIPQEIIQRINICKFFIEDPKTNTLTWLIPLFEDQVTGFEWVKEWMEGFGDINKDRKGTAKFVMPRMKKFFVENPSIRVDEVIGATKMYFANVDNPQYLKSSHKFIMEGKGAEKNSMLLEWVEKYKNWESITSSRTSLTNTMQ